MTAYNFNPMFSNLIETGRKRQTIRKRRKDGRNAKPGCALQLYTGMRTKTCRKLRDAVCASVTPIYIQKTGITVAETELRSYSALTNPVLDIFAQADGFIDWPDMRDWFNKTHGLPFQGILIRW